MIKKIQVLKILRAFSRIVTKQVLSISLGNTTSEFLTL